MADRNPISTSKRKKRMFMVGGALCALFAAGGLPAVGQASPARAAAPSLGTASSFAVLGASTVTNTGPSTVNGNLGVSPGTAIIGFPPGIVTGGTFHSNDGVAAQAHSDAAAAYGNLAGQACNFNLTGQDLGGKTLTPGVYCFSSSAQLTGTVTLDAQGNPNAVFIFQIGSTLTTASNSSVSLIGAQACNVYWQVGTSATLGTGTSFAGNILSSASNTLTTGASVAGRAIALNGAVTMDSNSLAAISCASIPVSTLTSTVVVPGSPTATSLPATATAIAAATSTAAPKATNTAVAAATNTAVAQATATAVVAATNTAIIAAATSTAVVAPISTSVAAATNTAVAAPTFTAIAAATNTAVAAPTNTAIAAATNTAIAAATSTAVATAVSTPVVAASNTSVVTATATSVATDTGTPAATMTSTAVAGATSTAVAGATSTAVARATRTRTARATTVPASTPTGTSARTARPHATATTTPYPLLTRVPRTGGGGSAFTGLDAPVGTGHQARLGNYSPRTDRIAAVAGTRSTGSGGMPLSPLLPLVLLGGVAIVARKFVLREMKR